MDVEGQGHWWLPLEGQQDGVRPAFSLGSWTSSVFEFSLQECVPVLSDEEGKGKISSWDCVMRAGLGEGQQNCGDPEVTQAVGTAFAKPWWGERSRIHRSSYEQLEMRLLNFVLASVWN